MNARRNEAYKLRIQGYSYNEINTKLGIPKSTLSGWLKDVILSDAARTRLRGRLLQGSENGFLKRNKLQTAEAERRARENQRVGADEIGNLSERELLLVGTALYWAEGYKRLLVRNGRELVSHPVRFVNSDPDMIRIFLAFLRSALNVSPGAIHLAMRLYPHINEEAARHYWMSVTELPKENFRKTTYLISGASKGVRPYNRLPWGTLQVAVNNTSQFHHLLGWITGMKDGF